MPGNPVVLTGTVDGTNAVFTAPGPIVFEDVYVDRSVALPERIVWRYRDGRIEMHQRFGRVDGHDLVVAQDADIRLPAFHAYVNARITNYALNIDVLDSVFTKKENAGT